MTVDVAKLKSFKRPQGTPFNIGKLGHVVLHASDLERSTRFYVDLLISQ